MTRHELEQLRQENAALRLRIMNMCEHHPDERRPDCHMCLACRIEAAMRNDA